MRMYSQTFLASSPTGSKCSSGPGCAARSGRCRVRAGRRDLLMIVARRGARQLPRHRGRRQSAHRHQARHQHPAHRGEEGRLTYDQAPDPKLLNESRKRRWPRPSTRSSRRPPRRSRARISPPPWRRWQAPRAGRRLLRPGHRQHPGAGLAREPLAPVNRIRATTLTVADFSKIEG